MNGKISSSCSPLLHLSHFSHLIVLTLAILFSETTAMPDSPTFEQCIRIYTSQRKAGGCANFYGDDEAKIIDCHNCFIIIPKYAMH